MKLSGRKWFGYIFTSLLIIGITIFIIFNVPDAIENIAVYIIGGLIVVYLIFAASNIIKSFIKSAWFQEKLNGKDE